MIFTDIPPPPEEEKEKKPEPKYQPRGAFKSPLTQKHTPERLKETKFAERPEEVTFTLLERGDQGFDLAVDLDRGKIAKALEIYKGVSPDVAAKAQTIAKERGIPFDFVNGNMEEWQSWQEARGVLTSLFETDTQGRYKYPFTANWLSNPAKMAVSRDDVEALRQIEGLIIAGKPWFKERPMRFLQALKGGLQSQVTTLRAHHEFFGPKLAMIPENIAAMLPGNLGVLVAMEKSLGEQGRKQVSGALQKAEQSKFLAPIPIPRSENPIAAFTQDFVSNMPQQVQGLAISYAGGSPVIGSVSMYGRIFGPTYRELIDKGVDPDRAFYAATIHAGLESILEYGGLYTWMDMLQASGASDVAMGVVRSMITNFVQEVLQEHTEVGARIWGEAELKGQTPTEQIQQFLKEEPETLKSGAYAGALAATSVAVSTLLHLPDLFINAQQLDQDIQYWDALNQKVGESKTFERSAEQGKEFVDTVLKQAGARETFSVSLDAINTLFQDNQRQVDKFLRDLDVKDQVPEAVMSGKEIEIKISKWLEKYAGTDLSLRLRENIRFDPRGMTLAERTKINEEIKGELETIQKNYQELIEQNRLPKQFIDMRDKLIATKEEGGAGMKAEDADAELSVFLAGATVLSRKGGETLEQWFSRVNPALEVGGEYVGTLPQAAPGTPPRGSVTFADGHTLINLYKSADMSTFIHESGHLFFNEMGKLVKSGKADAQLQADYLKLLRFAYKGPTPPPAVTTLPEGREIPRALEGEAAMQLQGNLPSDDDIDFEKIAKAFEEYIKEGRAPSPELIGSFRRLKNWLSAIYKALRGLDIEIDDEVRGVFDRLLAAEEDIKAVQEYYNTRRSIEEFVELDEQQKAALAERRGKAQESAIDAQVRRYLRAYYKALGGKKEIARQATDEINNLPVYQAIDEAVGKDGLSFESLKWEYGIDAVKELSQKHKGLISKKGTVLLRDLAAAYGFDSEAAMFEALVAADTKKEAVAARTKEIMDNTEAAIREDLAKQEEVAGEEALHTDENLEYQIAQAELLAQKIEREGKKKIPRPKNVTAKAYKDAAEAILADKTVALATRYDLFAKAEQRYAKEVWDALKKGDDEAAHAAWQKQILNHALVQAAVKARDERGKIIRRAKRIGNVKPEKVEYEYREAILALIERYGIGTPKMIPQRPEEVNIPALIASISDVEYAPAIPDWIQGMQGPENFRDLKFRQFQELNDAIVALYNAGRKDIRAKYLSEAIKERLGLEGEVLVNELTPYLAEPMEKLKSRHPVDEHHWFSGVQKLGRTILADLGLANIWVQEMDGYEGIGPHGVTGPNETVFMRTLAYADSEKKSIWDSRVAPRLEKDGDLLKGIRAIYNRMKKDPGLGKKFTIPNVPLGVDLDIRLRMEQLGRNLWTPERIIVAALNMGNEKNQRALMQGYGWSDEHIQMIQAMLTADEWQTIQHLWDFVNEFYYPMDEVYFRLNGSHTNKEPARAFSAITADGKSITLRGGYFPLMFDQALSDRAARHQEEDLFKNRTDAIFHNASTKSGFSKSRKGSTLPPKLDISVLYTHLNDVVHYITHAEAVRDLNRITLDPEWKSMVIEKFGVETYQQFREMLRYVARPQHGPVSGIDRIATRWRKLATLYALGYNLKSGMRQTLSMSNAAQEIGWNWADRGIGQLIRHPQQLFDQVNELSSYMANQAKSFDREVQEQLQSIKPFARNIEIAGRTLTLKDAQDTAFVFVRGFDKITRYAAWSGAYQKFMAENAGLPIEQRMTKAAGYADDIVAKTQPSARAMDLSHWQRGEGLGRLLNMFMTWTLKYGHRTRAYFRGWHEGQISTKDYARHVVNEQIIPAMGATAIAMGWAWATGKDDDDDKELANEFLYTGVNQLLSGYPILRDIPGAIRYPYYNNFLSVPAFQAAGSKHLKSITQGYKLFTGDDPLEKRAADLAYALALSVEFESGVPAIKVYRDLLNAYNAHVGD